MICARWQRHAVWLLVALGCCVLLAPRQVSATTGPSNYLPPSKYTVATKVQALYVGQYLFASAAPASHLTGGAMGIEVSDAKFLYGVAQFYGYNQAGSKSVWIVTLYNFRQSRGQMALDLLASGTTSVVGHLTVARAKNGDLHGQIQMGSGSYTISWHKVSSR